MIYFLQRENKDIKIGTTVNLNIRLSDLIKEHGNLTLLGLIKGDQDIESGLHDDFKAHRRGTTEWFAPSPSLLEFISQNSQMDLPRVEVPMVSVKISKHVKYMLDVLRADVSAVEGVSQTHDDILWDTLQNSFPDYAAEAINRLGARVKPKRGYSKKQP